MYVATTFSIIAFASRERDHWNNSFKTWVWENEWKENIFIPDRLEFTGARDAKFKLASEIWHFFKCDKTNSISLFSYPLDIRVSLTESDGSDQRKQHWSSEKPLTRHAIKRFAQSKRADLLQKRGPRGYTVRNRRHTSSIESSCLFIVGTNCLTNTLWQVWTFAELNNDLEQIWVTTDQKTFHRNRNKVGVQTSPKLKESDRLSFCYAILVKFWRWLECEFKKNGWFLKSRNWKFHKRATRRLKPFRAECDTTPLCSVKFLAMFLIPWETWATLPLRTNPLLRSRSPLPCVRVQTLENNHLGIITLYHSEKTSQDRLHDFEKQPRVKFVGFISFCSFVFLWRQTCFQKLPRLFEQRINKEISFPVSNCDWR